MPKGPAAAAALLAWLPPVVAVRFLHDFPDQGPPLLTPDVRGEVEPLLQGPVAEVLQQVGVALKEALTVRTAQQLLLLRQYGSEVAAVTCSQLVAIINLLGAQGQSDRCAAIVALWAKVADRGSLVEVFESLSGAEQLGLMSSLGSYHVWATLARPDGLHFRLDLTQNEQRDVAREVVKVAVRKSLAERASTGQRVRQLENLTAEGKALADPEDDKLWLSLESKHRLLEFDYARTWEQELHLMVGAVKRIQRAWRKRSTVKAASSSSGLLCTASSMRAPVSPSGSGVLFSGASFQTSRCDAGTAAATHTTCTAATTPTSPSGCASQQNVEFGLLFDRTKEQFQENQTQQQWPASPSAVTANAAVGQLQHRVHAGAGIGVVPNADQPGRFAVVDGSSVTVAACSSIGDCLSLCSSPTADMRLGQVGWSAVDCSAEVLPDRGGDDGSRHQERQGSLGRDGHAAGDVLSAGRQVDLLRGLAQHRALHGGASFGASRATPRFGDGQFISDPQQ
eukprot:gene13115-13244_t